MNAAIVERIAKALRTLSIEGIDFNADFEIEGFWSVQEDVPAAKNWDDYLQRIELGDTNYRLIPMAGVSLLHVGQTSPTLAKTIDYYIVELSEGAFSVSHHVDLGIDDGFIIGSLDLVPDSLLVNAVISD